MHLLVEINNNVQEWRDTLRTNGNKPRLPLPYAFGGAFLRRGHRLSAIDVFSLVNKDTASNTFQTVYHQNELKLAMDSVDLVCLWGGHGIYAILKQPLLSKPRKRVLLSTYVWQLDSLPRWKSKKLGLATHLAARFAKGIVVMTQEQAKSAREALLNRVPVLNLRCGIDTAYYRSDSDDADVPEAYRDIIDRLLTKPYMIMPGDELRCDQDALDIIEKSDLRLVRISQYFDKSRTDLLKLQIQQRRLADRIIVFGGISYSFMRFLLHHAAVYAGLVDSAWQPAGWTVACEALASGLPIVLYEGFVSRELSRLGAGDTFFRSVPMHDICSFQKEVERFTNAPQSLDIQDQARGFAKNNLDLERTGLDFVEQVEGVVNHGLVNA